MRVGVLGTVISTEVAIEALIESGLKPEFVVTLPPESSHRHSDYVDLQPLCLKEGISCWVTDDANDPAVVEELRSLDVDVILVIGWSRLVGEDFRRIARKGVIGYHPTLLPKMRGRAALAWTIELDVRRTGGTLFWIDDGIDTGDIFAQEDFDLTGDEYLGDLIRLQMSNLRSLVRQAAEKLKSGSYPRRAQNHEEASFLSLRRPQDAEIDWRETADTIQRLIRAVSKPYPGAFSHLGGTRITIWRASVIDMHNWHALVGQLFSYADGDPVVRCGGSTSLRLQEFDLDTGTLRQAGSQPVLGRKHAQP